MSRSETGSRAKTPALGTLFNLPNILSSASSDFSWKLPLSHPVIRSQPLCIFLEDEVM